MLAYSMDYKWYVYYDTQSPDTFCWNQVEQCNINFDMWYLGLEVQEGETNMIYHSLFGFTYDDAIYHDKIWYVFHFDISFSK